MRNLGLFSLGIFLLVFSMIAKPNSAVSYANLNASINEWLRELDHKAIVGIKIKSMRTGQIIYAHNDHRLFIPASILKILTAEAALIYLGPNYKFTTTLATSNEAIENGRLNGDLYVVYSGDPSLNFYDLTDLTSYLKSYQISKINGRIYIDNTAYDQLNYAPGWSLSDQQYCYSAPINATILNHNCLAFRITPGMKRGSLARLTLNPHYFYAGIRNAVMTKPSWARNCYVTANVDSTMVTLTGCLPQGHYSQSAAIVIKDLLPYHQQLWRYLFKRFGISTQPIIGVKKAPNHLVALAQHHSKTLDLLIKEMLKNSDNIIAESLFKKLGQTFSKQPGSWRNGSLALSHILSNKVGVNTGSLSVIDGSGLSLDNRVTPTQVLQLLNFAYHYYPTSYEFISSLPIAGVDGTLKHRLKEAKWKIRAKTGTLSNAGITSLAGYATTKGHDQLAFVIIVNGQNGNIWKYRELADKIAFALTRLP